MGVLNPLPAIKKHTQKQDHLPAKLLPNDDSNKKMSPMDATRIVNFRFSLFKHYFHLSGLALILAENRSLHESAMELYDCSYPLMESLMFV